MKDKGGSFSQLSGEEESILLVEQNLQFALNVANRVSLLSRGKVVHESTDLELSQQPDIQFAYLGVGQSEAKEMKPSE